MPGVGWLVFVLGGLLYLVDLVVQAYINNQRDLGAVLSLFELNYSTRNFLVDGNHLFEVLRGAIVYRRQGIVCYWNTVDVNGMPVLQDCAHFVYVRNDVLLDGKYYIYNFSGYGPDALSLLETNMTEIVGSQNIGEANSKMIAFYVIQ